MPHVREKKLLQPIESFIEKCLRTQKPMTEIELTNFMEIAKKEHKLNTEEVTTLKNTLMLQNDIVNRAQNNHSNAGTPINWSLFFLHSNCHSSFGYGHGGNLDGDAALFVVAVIAVTSALVAAYGMAKDLYEISKELCHSQRIIANLATLALTATYVAAAAFAVSVFIYNPFSLGILGSVILVSTLVVGVAALIKATRLVVNRIDGALSNSALSSDSRFQLTKDEKNRFNSPEDLHKAEAMVRMLAVEASKRKQTGFFGTNDAYKTLIKTLASIKNGDVPKNLSQKYELNV